MMAPTNKKRKRSQQEHSTPSQKKQRKTTTKTIPSKRNMRLDDLAWKKVEIPDDLDDYEGIYGLEEVDDVEVIRDPLTKVITYRATDSKANESTEENTGYDDGESWGGFSSDNGSDAGANETGDTYRVISRRGSNAGKEEYINGTEQVGQNTFAGLEEEDLDDDTYDEGVADMSAWKDLNLSWPTISSLSKLKFKKPTPIQSAAIPEILAGHDVIGKASTGSGKTLAFGIPILEHYLTSDRFEEKAEGKKLTSGSPIALIMSPTRELAHQLSDHLMALSSRGNFDGLTIATITGGLSVQKQQRLLSMADIVIGTPGRLWEIMSSGQGATAKLRKIEFLVIDEADRLLSQGHFKELEEILAALDRQEEDGSEDDEGSKRAKRHRQTLIFSATFHKGLQQKLSAKGKSGGDLMNQKESMEYLLRKLNFREETPKLIDVNPASQMATGLREGILECDGMEKDLYLYALILLHPNKHTLVFTNSISSVRRLTPLMANLNIPALSLHSEMPQKARLRSVERFTAAKSSVLIATDVAARGLDIPGVQLILHYHVPRAADGYVHRSGRTARAGLEGSSILLCSPDEVAGVRRLVAKVHAQSTSNNNARALKSLDIDRRVVSHLKPRLQLAKRIADVGIAKDKKSSRDSWMKQAAEDLGVDYDSEEFEQQGSGGKRGRGAGRRKKERENREVTKDEVKAMRAELKSLLAKRVNVGVSERYLTSGGLDVDALLKGDRGEFLGSIGDLGFDV